MYLLESARFGNHKKGYNYLVLQRKDTADDRIRTSSGKAYPVVQTQNRSLCPVNVGK